MFLHYRPTWQTEFEQEENELRQVWDDYITKHKNLMYLERQLQELEEQQQQQLKHTLVRRNDVLVLNTI